MPKRGERPTTNFGEAAAFDARPAVIESGHGREPVQVANNSRFGRKSTRTALCAATQIFLAAQLPLLCIRALGVRVRPCITPRESRHHKKKRRPLGKSSGGVLALGSVVSRRVVRRMAKNSHKTQEAARPASRHPVSGRSPVSGGSIVSSAVLRCAQRMCSTDWR